MSDASSTVAAASAGSILAISWVATAAYLFSYDKRGDGNHVGGTKEDDKSYTYSWTFHVESLRFFGFLGFMVLLVMGALITEQSGLDTIKDPTETVIFKLFGINHSCNWVDHNPAKMLASILLMPLAQVPMMLYIVFWHCRLAKDVKNGKVPKWLLNMSRILSPFNFITMAELQLWFVNNPDDTYGFTAHYIPYLMFQIAVCLMQIQNILYLSAKNDLPWGLPTWSAWTYTSFFAFLTIFYTVYVVSTIAGHPILYAPNSDTELLLTQLLFGLWASVTIAGTLIFSAKEMTNGDVMTLKLGDNIVPLSLETGSGGDAPDDDGASLTNPMMESI